MMWSVPCRAFHLSRLTSTPSGSPGEAIDRSHFTSMYSRAIEAASRGEGFTAADIGGLAAHMDTETDRLEYLHQGMYLGFKGLRRSSSDRLNALWDDPMWWVLRGVVLQVWLQQP